MNRYPLWKNLLILFTIVLAIVYTLPNLYGVTSAIQISTNRQSLSINEARHCKKPIFCMMGCLLRVVA